jgi:hypothetical protein
MQSNKLDRLNRPEEQDRLADFFSILFTSVFVSDQQLG